MGRRCRERGTRRPRSAGRPAGGEGIFAIDDEAVDSALSLIAHICERPVGTEVTLGIVRDGEAQEVTITLDPRA